MPTGVKDIDKPMTLACNIVVLGSVLQSERDVKVTTNALNTERCIPLRKIVISEGANQVKIRVEHLDLTKAEIRGIEERAIFVAANSQPFINCTRTYGRAVHGQDCIGRVDCGVPAGDRAIFGRENETGCTRFTTLRNNETSRAIKDNPGWRCKRSTSSSSWRWDGDYQWASRRRRECVAVAIIERGYPCAIV